MDTAGSAFDQAYGRGVLAERRPGAATDITETETATSFVGADGFAVGGCVITPSERVDDGFVTVAPDGTVAEVGSRRPTWVPVLDTGGVVLPGLVDLPIFGSHRPVWRVWSAPSPRAGPPTWWCSNAVTTTRGTTWWRRSRHGSSWSVWAGASASAASNW